MLSCTNPVEGSVMFTQSIQMVQAPSGNKIKMTLGVDLGVKNGKTFHPESSWFGIGNETAEYQLYISNFIVK